MLKNTYKSHIVEQSLSARFYKILTLILAISHLLAVLWFINYEFEEKVIIHPLSLTQKYAVDKENPDPLYIEKLATELLSARFHYIPDTVSFQFENLAKHFHPSIYGLKKSELANKAKFIKKRDESSAFYPMSIYVSNYQAFITADIKTYLGKKNISEKLRTFQMDFEYSGGRIWLKENVEVETFDGGKTYIKVEDKEGAEK
ncbi:TraE/TraK family type IV conjugative transfer system protein [Algicola sagamiensis]|uniref:TraE/TraK family type IV conjugative transfer system protein n=1 Tax=Algicola sagamiensis TaxID=163869 RepID=UPI000372C613|nr:TraE/TraK family type IV conjugative transfer system protein [Algicola sagamiensis]